MQVRRIIDKDLAVGVEQSSGRKRHRERRPKTLVGHFAKRGHGVKVGPTLLSAVPPARLPRSEHLPARQLAGTDRLGEQLVVPAGLDDPAFLEHVDAIGLDDAVEAMRDHDPADAPS